MALVPEIYTQDVIAGSLFLLMDSRSTYVTQFSINTNHINFNQINFVLHVSQIALQFIVWHCVT